MRTAVGALLSLILAGEINVSARTGLFTPAGLIALAGLYVCYFWLFDALACRFALDRLGAVLVNFALYSVLITGFLHGELLDYRLHPEQALFVTLIRAQASVFPIFVYALLRDPGSLPGRRPRSPGRCWG